MRISELAIALHRHSSLYGNVPVVLWEGDTGHYYTLTAEHIEAQRMEDGSCRLSIGVNSYDDVREREPKERPL